MTRTLLVLAAGALLLGACNKIQRTPPLTENRPLVPGTNPTTDTTEGKNTSQSGSYDYLKGRKESPYF